MTTQNKPLLQREIRYYARRSIREMDTYCQNMLASGLDDLTTEDLVLLRDLLLMQDYHILAWLHKTAPVPAHYTALIDAIRPKMGCQPAENGVT